MLASMRIPVAAFKLLAGLALAAAASSARGEVLEASVKRIRTGAGSLESVQLVLDWPRGAAQGSLRIRADRLRFPAIAYDGRRIDWRCPLRRDGAGAWRCAGPVLAAGAKPQQLAIRFAPEGLDARLGAKTGLGYASRSGAPGLGDVALHQVPVAWLKPFLAGLWAQGQWNAGTVDGSLRIASPDKGPFTLAGDLRLAGVDLETPDGLLATDDLAGRMRIDYRQAGAATHVDARLDVTGGELLADRLYARFPRSPVSLRVVADRAGTAPWRLGTLEARDPGVLEAHGGATLAADNSVRELDLDIDVPNLAVAGPRYFSGFLAPEGFADLVLGGRLVASLALREGTVHSASARFAGVNAVDTKARFTFAGLDGKLAWTRGAAAQASEFGWDSGALFGIGLGPARFPLTSADGALALRAPVRVAALGGHLVLDRLRWQAPRGTQGAEVGFGLAMEAMDLASLSQRLGWPAFTGTISGRIPSATLRNDVLTTDGGLEMQVFGGRVRFRELSMERPFGTLPTLSADVTFDDLDLEPLTAVVGFGSITGRLDGRMDKLRLVDWSPTAFEAWFETDPAWKGKRRISQRAVNDITSVGGGGVAGGLQAQALKLFDDFAYSRIGIGCTLRDGVCTMDGIGSAGDGYIIVAGAGLPRIQVVGFRRKVDWPTLVARLRAAGEGQAPVID
jgi:hypothetical protein